MSELLSYFLHLDVHLQTFVVQYGPWTYALLFLIVFCETGLIVTPFLPGDSLLFAAGTLSALGALNIVLLVSLFIVAAFLGDLVNYWIGRTLGHRLLTHQKLSRFINPSHLERTKTFYAKHGKKTIVLARFFPIIRTFAPFVAGLGHMPLGSFLTYNLLGGVLWVCLFTLGGYFFGTISIVKENFTAVIIGIVFVSIIPTLFGLLKKKERPAPQDSTTLPPNA